MGTKELGNQGEQLACEYLVEKGFIILGRNYRITFGEIDIIAKKREQFLGKTQDIIHFVEVKSLATKASDFTPEQRVDYKKQRKLRQLAEIWLQKNKLPQTQPYQIDIISVTISPEVIIDFFENAVEDF